MRLLNPVGGYLKVVLQPKVNLEDLYYLRLPYGDSSISHCTDFKKESLMRYSFECLPQILEQLLKNYLAAALQSYIIHVVYFYESDISPVPFSTMYCVPSENLKLLKTFNTLQELQQFLKIGDQKCS